MIVREISSKGFVKLSHDFPTDRVMDLLDLRLKCNNSFYSHVALEKLSAILDVINCPELSDFCFRQPIEALGEVDVIARCVTPGDSSESFKAHLDSHRYTVVVPLSIPKNNFASPNRGQLVLLPKYVPVNLVGFRVTMLKLFLKMLPKRSWSYFYEARSDRFHQFDLSEREILVFDGYHGLHFNLPVDESCDSRRVTLLIHLGYMHKDNLIITGFRSLRKMLVRNKSVD